MPIPPFDGILNVLPPHTGDPTDIRDLTPYPCTIQEVCTRFNSSASRKAILNGFLDLRELLYTNGVTGFQWIGGSFVEDIEAHEGRDPHDIDVVTFVDQPADPFALHALIGPLNLLDNAHTKATFLVDHFVMPLGSMPDVIVNETRYWCGLFSHRRDHLWKGMLEVDLLDKSNDDAARQTLETGP